METFKLVEPRVKWHKYMGSEHKDQKERINELLKNIETCECTEINDAAELIEMTEIVQKEPEYFNLSQSAMEYVSDTVAEKVNNYMNSLDEKDLKLRFATANEYYKDNVAKMFVKYYFANGLNRHTALDLMLSDPNGYLIFECMQKPEIIEKYDHELTEALKRSKMSKKILSIVMDSLNMTLPKSLTEADIQTILIS